MVLNPISNWVSRVRRQGSKLFAGAGLLRCRQSVRLTQQHTLHVVEFGSQQLLLVCHPGGAALLSEGCLKGGDEEHADSGLGA